MFATFAASVLLAVSTAAAGLPAAGLATPFPDQGDPITAVAYTEDLIEADYINGKLPADILVELESSAGCLLEEEAAEAWLRLEKHALRDGVEFTASWCYRNMKTQRRTYRRNCPWVVVEPVVAEPTDPNGEEPSDPGEGDSEEADPGGHDDPAAGEESPEAGAEPPEANEPEEPVEKPERIRVCRVPTAKPGNSNHGWGRAVDLTIEGALMTCESDSFLWLVENAGRYGWVHPAWAACGAEKEEAWHWEWGGTDYSGPTLSQLGQITT